jgi:hypothetical protein
VPGQLGKFATDCFREKMALEQVAAVPGQLGKFAKWPLPFGES